MLQVFFLTEVYLVLYSFVLLSDKYGVNFLFMYSISDFACDKKIRPLSVTLAFVLFVGNLFVPMNEEIYVLGDALPALALVLCFVNQILNKNKKNNGLGYFTLSVAILHFLFPRVIIL